VSFKTRDVKRIDELNGLEQTANYGLVTAYGAVGAALGGFAALTLTAVGVSEGAALTVGGAAGAAEYVGPATEHKPNLNPMNNQRVLQVLQSVDLHSADSSWSVDLNKPCEALAVLDQMAMKAARTGDAVADASSLKGAVTESKEKRSVASEIGRMLSISLDSDNATLIHAGEMK
jgi:urease gamma subunit